MIIITTVGRAGSSFLTLFLANCELDVGSKKWFDVYKAGLENHTTCHINSQLIKLLVKKEDTKQNLWHLKGEIADLEHDVVKDPQFVCHPEIIRTWWEVRKDLKIIFLDRNPMEVVESCKRLPEWNNPTYRLFPEMIEKKNSQFLDTVDKLGIPIMSFKYPNFAREGDKTIQQLSKWIELPDNALKIWNKLSKR